MKPAPLTLAIRYERDVVLARQRARQLAGLIGFDAQDQARLATAVSEIARNAFTYAGGGTVEFSLEGTTPPQLFIVRIADKGRGIPDLQTILNGQYRSPTGMGLGIVGARRLVDQFEIVSSETGTTVALKRFLPRRAGLVGADEVGRLVDSVARQPPADPLEELQRQNQELLAALDELGRRQQELAALNRELEDTNRGVVALYAELDEKADHLRRADELKSRFLSNMSHEFRTPVNSIQALSRMLIERTDGDLTAEQERQVTFIRKAADALGELVSDLLDLAKVEAGKIVVRPVEFDVEHLFGALRGMLRPLLVGDAVTLVFEATVGLPPLHTDEAKVSQILRNFISNALKFTERGEVRVAAALADNGRAVAFTVTDSGIGIAAEDLERIFHEFTQIDSALQRRVQGTGLGLPLCRKLSELLGGTVSVESTPGVGSAFTALIPVVYEAAEPEAPRWDLDSERIPVLAIDDSSETLLVYERMVRGSPFQILGARSVTEATQALASVRPRVIVLDILLRGEDSWGFLAELKRRPDTQDIPIAVVSTVEDQAKGLALGANAYCVKPIDRHVLLQTLTRLVAPESMKHILIVDDEEISRYVLRQHLQSPHHLIAEAASGNEALQRARTERPDVICLDLTMPDLDGYEVLRRLKSDPDTIDIPVVIVTSRHIEERERQSLLQSGTTIVSKDVAPSEAAAAVGEAMRMTEQPTSR